MGDRTYVKSGELLLQNKGILKTTWQTKFCLLYGRNGNKSCYLEFYDDRKSYEEHMKKQKPCDKKVELQNVTSMANSVQTGNDGTAKYQIEIKYRGNKSCLMFDSKSDCSDWFAKIQLETGMVTRSSNSSLNREDENDNDINEDYDDESEVITLNQLYDGSGGAQAQRFSVKVEPCTLAKLCDIEGDMTMLVTNQCISFENPKTRQNKYLFQLTWMRRFGKKGTDEFYFECGRKCPNGEGTVSCHTLSATEIHKVITTKSASNSKIVIPGKQKFKGQAGEKKSPEVKAKVNPTAPNITGPTYVQKKQHPGLAKVPTLVPIQAPNSEYDDVASAATLRNSIWKSSGNGANVGHVSQNDFNQELEGFLHGGDDHTRHASLKKPNLTDSKKEKKEREKREKKEAEEREKKEKKEAEEREKREKKEEGEREKDRLKREKEEKERKKKEDKMKAKNPKKGSINRSAGAYDDVIDNDASSSSVADDGTYAESTDPTPLPKSKAFKSGDGLIYNDPDVHKVLPSRAEPVQYAEPYKTTGGVPIVADGATYSEVKDFGKGAWKNQGREEKDMIFEEDYSVIKQAREQNKGPPPDLPARRYSQTDSDEENTYDTMASNAPKPSRKPENLYGMASAKKVGIMLPQTPAADYPEDSGEEEDNKYSHCADTNTYEEADKVMGKTSRSSGVPSSLYEETDRPVTKPPIKASKLSITKKKAPAESLYEEVKM